MSETHELGKKGESIATGHLTSKGFKILETNWHAGSYELDIIAEKEDLLVVAEVKTRTSTAYGEPELSVNKTKQKFMIRAANTYITNKGIDKEVRFDIIAITFKGKSPIVNHLEDAFYPTL